MRKTLLLLAAMSLLPWQAEAGMRYASIKPLPQASAPRAWASVSLAHNSRSNPASADFARISRRLSFQRLPSTISPAPASRQAGATLDLPQSSPFQESFLLSENAEQETLAEQSAAAFDGLQKPKDEPQNVPTAPAIDPRALRLIISGPPGSGKGTFSKRISAQYGMVHISLGELLREYAKTHPDIADTMARGELVDTRLVMSILQERLNQADAREHGFILDGTPRRIAEARSVAKILGSYAVDGVIILKVPRAELLRRISQRGRADDDPKVFQERMRIYQRETIPALRRFKQASLVLQPNVASSDVEANYNRVKEALLKLFKTALRLPGASLD